MTAVSAGEAPVTGAAYTSFLAQLPFFVGVPAEDLSAFANTVLVRELPAGADVVVQRQYGHALFVLMSGSVVIHAIGPDDVSVTLGRLARPGDFFGEAALLGRGERTATVTAETPITLLEIEKHRFDLLTRRHKPVRDHLEGVYHARAIATYLRTHRYLSLLDDGSRAELGRGAKLRMFQRGDAVVKAGDPADAVLVIKDGVAKATRHSSQAGGPGGASGGGRWRVRRHRLDPRLLQHRRRRRRLRRHHARLRPRGRGPSARSCSCPAAASP